MSNNKKIYNPFILSGYVSEEYFCDRRAETEALLEDLKNGRNVTMLSRRRMGKTALMYHLFRTLTKRNQYYHSMYVDLFPTQDLKGLTQSVLSGLLQEVGSDFNSWPRKLLDLVKSIGAALSFDPVTGLPKVSFRFHRVEEAQRSLEAMFDYLSQDRKPWVIALDEIQQISEYPQKGAEAYLRSLMQQHPEVRFLFAGSIHHLVWAMFTEQGRPFYRSTRLLQLEPIDLAAYESFILHHFRSAGKQMDPEVPAHIYRLMKGQTYGIQLLCNRLFGQYVKVDVAAVEECVWDLLVEEQAVFSQIRQLITTTQWKLLTAIAAEGVVTQPLASDFIRRYELKAASSVQTALKALLDKALIIQEDGYEVQDVLLAEWLRRMFR